MAGTQQTGAGEAGCPSPHNALPASPAAGGICIPTGKLLAWELSRRMPRPTLQSQRAAAQPCCDGAPTRKACALQPQPPLPPPPRPACDTCLKVVALMMPPTPIARLTKLTCGISGTIAAQGAWDDQGACDDGAADAGGMATQGAPRACDFLHTHTHRAKLGAQRRFNAAHSLLGCADTAS